MGPRFLLLTQCLNNSFVAWIWQRIQSMVEKTSNKTEKRQPLPHRMLIGTSLAYVLAMGSSNEAIPLVSYPVAVLAKSCKLIPSLIMGQLLENHLYSRQEWTSALSISIGISLFQWSRMQETDAFDNNSTYGMLLLLLSLTMDGILSSCQNFLKRCDPKYFSNPTAVETMFWVNVYATLALVPACLWGNQWQTDMELIQDPQMALKIFILNTAVAVGQIFIFLTLVW